MPMKSHLFHLFLLVPLRTMHTMKFQLAIVCLPMIQIVSNLNTPIPPVINVVVILLFTQDHFGKDRFIRSNIVQKHPFVPNVLAITPFIFRLSTINMSMHLTRLVTLTELQATKHVILMLVPVLIRLIVLLLQRQNVLDFVTVYQTTAAKHGNLIKYSSRVICLIQQQLCLSKAEILYAVKKEKLRWKKE